MTKAAKRSFATPDEYLAMVPEEKRVALQRLREAIRKIVPEAEECISYGLPSFRLAGKTFLSYGAAAKHCAFYAGSTMQKFSGDLKGYSTSKGTIRFSPDQPLPKSLIRRLVKQRIRDRSQPST